MHVLKNHGILNELLCIQGTAQKEKEKVSKLFAETARILATFQKEVLGFIEDGERAMLNETEEELRQKEERRALLTECWQNLEKVPSTDTISFLQVGLECCDSCGYCQQRANIRG